MSKKWDVNDRIVRHLCEEGRFCSAFKVGKTWMISEDARKPYDVIKTLIEEYKGLVFNFSKVDLMNNKIKA